ncbi:hypothetical protein H6783_03395 [Candidatus Nomurabacteria bacterium]|nr:hypothetical protein [Candidatus Nomurabacteria bacterium]
MKFYIAGKFEDKELVQALYERVLAAGHEVSYDWTTHKNIKPYAENAEQAQVYAENELGAILDSDVFIYLTSDRGHTLHMEFGTALAKAANGGTIRIYAVGEFNDRSPWYFNPRVTRVATADEVFADLGL